MASSEPQGSSSGSNVPPTLDTEAQVKDFVRKAYFEVDARRLGGRAAGLRQALKVSRDAVLSSAPTLPPRYYSRRLLISGETPPLAKLLYCQPVNNGDTAAAPPEAMASSDDPLVLQQSTVTPNTVSVRLRGSKNNKTYTHTLPAVPLEGAHEPLPPFTSTMFLKTHYATEDERDLSYVPYFGDDDREDVVSDLYNTEGREKMMEVGPEYQERAANSVIDETLRTIEIRLCGLAYRAELRKRIHRALATLLEQDVERIDHRYSLLHHPPPPSPAAAAVSKPESLSPYLSVMDSYRQCFCRRCFSYDCNMHGNLQKPDLQLQGELAVQKEVDGYWKETDEVEADEAELKIVPSLGSEDASKSDSEESATFTSNVAGSVVDKGPNKRSLSDAFARLEERHTSTKELTSFQKSVCERAHLIYQGDIDKMALMMDAPRQLVANYVAEQGIKSPEFQHVRPDTQGDCKKRKNGKTMKSYNASWLKRVEDAEIHPFFTPCDHMGPCSEENCSCVKNAFFCTKHCVWGEKSRNFFRGCACKGGKCCTKSCPCFAAKRECDPDLCRTCGACTDPPNKPAMDQRCRNDSISMRRHAHLLLAKSTIEDAGWGIYTKHALKKGDFVHEYVGEVISQEEAERRGRVYDKVNRSYLFNLCSDFVVDASRKGNKTRFANHSSKPNCETKMVNVNGDVRIGLFAREDIEPQTELFFDYRYDVAMDNALITKPGMTVDWMLDPKMANRVRKSVD